MQGVVKPNLRTFNTILRGCVRTGETEIARTIHKAMLDQGLAEDISTLGSLFQLNIQEWKMQKEASEILLRYEQLNGGSTSENFIVELAAVAAIAGNKKLAKQKLQKLANSDLEGNLKSRVDSINKFCSIPITPHPHPKESNLVHFVPTKEPLAISQLKINPDQPLNLEIGSGFGEWVIDRCTTLKNENWVALDIRYDRTHSSYVNMILNNIKNLVLLCGDAQDTLKSSVPDASFLSIYVNFPVPNLNEKFQLFTVEFISNLYRILLPNGHINVISDDKLYIDFIQTKFIEFTKTSKSKFNLTVEDATNNKLYNTFFDGLWKSRGRSSRHLLIATKQ